MSKTLEDIITHKSENHALDFKEVQYPLGVHALRYEILKDISAMANHPDEADKYIILGVTEQNGVAIGFRDVGNLLDEAQYQQFLLSNIEPKINFEYKPYIYNGNQLAYFRIFNNSQRPYLFKKDLSNSPGKFAYRVGDGYIRQGSSTRKLALDDFERIYQNRYTSPDRKSDLRVTPFIAKCTDEELSSYSLDFIDIAIDNLSNKSIDIDLELKLFKTDTINIIPQFDLKKEIQEKRTDEKRKRHPQEIFYDIMPQISFDVSTEQCDENILATRTKQRGERNAVSIAQYDSVAFAFCKELVIWSEDTGDIQGELIVRSDAFSGGVLQYPFTIKYSKK